MGVWSGTLSTLPSGTQITGAKLGTWHDALAALTDVWTDFSGSFAWTATTSNPAIVDGTIVAEYAQIGKLVIYRGRITMGASTTYGTGTWLISTPVSMVEGSVTGTAMLLDSSLTANRRSGCAFPSGLTKWLFYAGSGGVVDATSPFTWASGDSLTWTIIYEGA